MVTESTMTFRVATSSFLIGYTEMLSYRALIQ